jgi:hypothetical protein
VRATETQRRPNTRERRNHGNPQKKEKNRKNAPYTAEERKGELGAWGSPHINKREATLV